MEQDRYEITEERAFLKQKKDYSKKYPSLPKDVALFGKVVIARPDDGKILKSGGSPARLHLRKSRMVCKSLGRGKSGGFRVFYVQDILKRKLHLIAMALRSEERSVDYKELEGYLELLNS